MHKRRRIGEEGSSSSNRGGNEGKINDDNEVRGIGEGAKGGRCSHESGNHYNRQRQRRRKRKRKKKKKKEKEE